MREIDERPRDGGRFVAGHSYSPGTQIKHGQHLSRLTEIRGGQRISKGTEFKKGQEAHNFLPVGAVTYRDDPEGRSRAWVKTSNPNTWRRRASVVWEIENGPLQRGHVVHHKDDDCLNDSPDNLVAITRSEHTKIHRRAMHIAALAAIDNVPVLDFTIQWVKRGVSK